MREFGRRPAERLDESEWSVYGLFRNAPRRDKADVSSVDMVPTDANQCRVYSDGSSVYSNARFYPGDVVEVCPVREVSKQSLYSRDVRDMVFEVVPNERYVVPMGYCQCYDLRSAAHPEANCSWEWDPDRSAVVVRAACSIPRNTVLVLDVEK